MFAFISQQSTYLVSFYDAEVVLQAVFATASIVVLLTAYTFQVGKSRYPYVITDIHT